MDGMGASDPASGERPPISIPFQTFLGPDLFPCDSASASDGPRYVRDRRHHAVGKALPWDGPARSTARRRNSAAGTDPINAMRSSPALQVTEDVGPSWPRAKPLSNFIGPIWVPACLNCTRER